MKSCHIPFLCLRSWITGALFASATTVNALVVVVSGGHSAQAQIESYLTETFVGITEIRTGSFADFEAPATQKALDGADLVIIGRSLWSPDYSGGVSQGYNRLKIPVVVFTSLVVRASEDRLGWLDGNIGDGRTDSSFNSVGAETILTEAGAIIFGGSAGGHVDWHDSFDELFRFVGLGSVGTGSVLAKLGEGILVAHWDVGDAPGDPEVAGVDVFPGERLLFNLDSSGVAGFDEFGNLTPAGKEALITALCILKTVER